MNRLQPSYKYYHLLITKYYFITNILQSMKKQVYTYEKEIKIGIQQFGNTVFSLSKYTDCLIIIANQTGSLGSILEGQVIDSSGNLQEIDYQEEQKQKCPYIFQITVLLGSTEIQFYELLLRRMMAVIWEEGKATETFKLIFNVSLPVLHKDFVQQAYYKSLVEELRVGLKQIL